MPIDAERFVHLARVARAIPDPDGPSIEAAIESALAAGVRPELLAEAILQGIPYAGFPGAVEALGLLADRTRFTPLFPAGNPDGAASPPQDPSPQDPSPQVLSPQVPSPLVPSPQSFRAIYRDGAPAVRAALRARHPDLERWIIEFAYGTVMERGILGLAELEGLAVASLVGQRRRTPLHSHLRGALRTGWTADGLARLLDALAETADPATIEFARTIIAREA